MSPDDTEQAQIDAGLAKLRRIGKDRLVEEMIDLFQEHAPKWLEAARAGVDAGDWSAVARAAHTLKSSAGNFGAVSLYELCARIESLAAQSETAALPALLAELESTLGRVRTILQERRGWA
jgi:HPt (histidine-containing phosphotransfer) domain-containing protein